MGTSDPVEGADGSGIGPAASGILPWDRRVRVFVSSTLEELAVERAAVRTAIERLRLTPVMFELGARTHPPRELYASYLRESDVFVGIYGERYGWVSPGSTVSGLEDEYLLARDHPKLLYVKAPAPGREPRLTDLVERIWTTSGVSTAPFGSSSELAARVADDLAVLLTERFRAPQVDQPALDPLPLPHPATALLARDAELQAVVALVRDGEARLVTLLGPGGIGKTRLALAAAEALTPLVEAVCFVDLSALRSADQLLPALARALRVHPAPRPTRDLLVDVLADHRVLVVLDNMDHLTSAAASVAELLSACPGLQVLSTSRTVLRVRGEHQVTLPPLAVPDVQARDATTVGASPAAELFVRRARQVNPTFSVTDQNAVQLAEVLRRLEGIPLALEIVASRLDLLPLDRLLSTGVSELDLTSREVDVPDRQRTLRSTIAWSYQLLDDADQALARCLSVFPGSWTLAAAEAVAGGDVLDTLADLVGHSLVAVDLDAPGEPRFRMLNTVRAFLAEELERVGGRAAAMQQLTDYVVAFTQQAGDELRSGRSRWWRARVDSELETLRGLLDWAVASDDASLAVTVTAPLTWYWWSRGLLVEMLRRAERVADLPSANSLSAEQTALLRWCRGTMRIATGDVARARDLLAVTVRDARARGDGELLPLALFGFALTSSADAARPLLEESVRLFTERGDQWGRALSLIPLGELALLAGEADAARAAHQEALASAELIDDDHMSAVVLDQLAANALVQGEVTEAARLLCRSASLHLEVHDDEGIANCLDGFAALALVRGAPGTAAQRLLAADRLRRTAGLAVWPFLQPLRDQLAEAVRESVGADGGSPGAGEAGDEPPQDGLSALARARDEEARGPS